VWETRRCDEEDDFDEPLRTPLDINDFCVGDRVLLLRPDAVAWPADDDFGSYASVIAVEYVSDEQQAVAAAVDAGEDVLRRGMRTRSGTRVVQERERRRVARVGPRERLVLRVEPQADVVEGSYDAVSDLKEVYLEQVEAVDASRGSSWRVVPRARLAYTPGAVGDQSHVDLLLPSVMTAALVERLHGAEGVKCMLSPAGIKQLARLEKSMPGAVLAWADALCKDSENFAGARGPAKASQQRSLRDLANKLRSPLLLDAMAVVPVKALQRSSAKYEVRLREEPLQATRVVHTILTRMVVFHCDVCRERFPAYHPAFEPPAHLQL